jgi:hypothetical protein
MKKLIILILCLLYATSVNAFWVKLGGPAGGGGGGTPTYYYGGSDNTTDGASSNYDFGSYSQLGDDITIITGGDVTEICLELHTANNTASNFKIGLYYDDSGTWTLHEQGTGSYSNSDTGYQCHTLTSSYAVGSSEQVWVIYSIESGGDISYDRESGGHYSSSGVYDTDLPATVSISDEWEYGVRLTVE